MGLEACCDAKMQNIETFKITFHDFSFYPFAKHPLRKLFALQFNLRHIELHAMLIWKDHDIANCLQLMLDAQIVHSSLRSLIVHNFVILPSNDEAQQLKQHKTSNVVMLKSAQILGEFLIKCKNLKCFRWYFEQKFATIHTCYGIYIAFVQIYFKSSQLTEYGIEDLHLPSFPHSVKSEEQMLYAHIVSKCLRLRRLHYRGDFRMIDWKMMQTKKLRLEHLSLEYLRAPNELFTDCFVCCGESLKFLSLDTASLGGSGWYHQSDELANFVIPYFRSKCLAKLEKMEIIVKFLEEASLFAFLSKAKYLKRIRCITIIAQSFDGNLKNEDLRKYIAQFIGTGRMEFTLSIKSQFYASTKILSAVRLSENDGSRILIDREQWKRKKRNKIVADVC